MMLTFLFESILASSPHSISPSPSLKSITSVFGTPQYWPVSNSLPSNDQTYSSDTPLETPIQTPKYIRNPWPETPDSEQYDFVLTGLDDLPEERPPLDFPAFASPEERYDWSP